MTFKFTRGGIKLNLEKLDYFQKRYRNALIYDRREDLADQEQPLVIDLVVQPVLRQADEIARGARPESGSPPPAWSGALELVPSMKDESSRQKYVMNVITDRPNSFTTPGALLKQHYYMFFRVPDAVYRASLAACPLSEAEEAALKALSGVVAEERLWESDGDASPLVQEDLNRRLRGQEGFPVGLHRVCRLVATGERDADTMQSAGMFSLLGRLEWRHRIAVLEKMLQEHAGDSLTHGNATRTAGLSF